MEHQPFSVAISVYKNDNPIFFDRALESITDQQTIKPDEIVLVVDGPVSREIDSVIDKYLYKCNLKVIRLERNCGLGNALRVATKNCSNELIARMDSDDVATNDRFEQQLDFFKNNPTIDILGGDISEFVGDESNIVSYRTLPTTDSKIKGFLKKRCPFNHMTVMFNKKSIIDSGGYLDWHYNEDYYLWIRMALKNFIFANTGTVLVNVRTGKDQFERRGGLKYFNSEKALQKFMLNNKIISFPQYCLNCFKRFVVQVIMPSKIRGYIYKKVIRGKKK